MKIVDLVDKIRGVILNHETEVIKSSFRKVKADLKVNGKDSIREAIFVTQE